MASGVVNNLLSNSFGNRAFNWVSWNDSRLDSLPTYYEEWIACAYSPDWANEPQYGWGIVFKMCVPDSLWGWEVAITTDAKPVVFIRNSINGNPWSAWEQLPLNPLFWYTDTNILSYFDSQPTTASTSTYTCPNNGWIYMYADRGSTAGNTLYIYVDGVQRYAFPAYNAYATASVMIPVMKGQVIKLSTDTSSPTWTIRQMSFKN